MPPMQQTRVQQTQQMQTTQNALSVIVNRMGMPGAGRLLVACLVAMMLAGCGGKSAEEHLAEARQHVAEGEQRAAVIELKNALRQDPRLGPAHALLGELRYNQGDLQNALKDLNKALDLGVDDAGLRLNLLNVKLGLGQFSEVIGELEGRESLPPEFAIALGEAYLLAQDLEQAQPLFQKNLQLSDGLLGMSKLAFLQNDTPRALKYALQAVETDPDNASAWLFKGELELIGSDSDAAVKSFKEAQNYALTRINGRIGEVRALLVADDLEAARKKVDQLTGKGGGGPHAAYLQAVISFRQGDLEAAEDALAVVNEYDASNLQALYLTGVVHYRQGKLALAQRSLRRYLKEDENNVPVRKLLAAIANDQNRPEEVVELLQPVAAHYSDPQVWAMLGSALMRLGQAESATEAFQSAVSLAPDMAAFRNQLALGLLSAGEGDSAIRELNSAIELEGDQLQSEYLLVMVKTREGDLDGAQAAVDDLLERSPDDPVVHNLDASVALARGDEVAGKAALEQALAVDPAYFPAVQSLASLAERAGNIDEARDLYTRLSTTGHEGATLALVDLAVRQGNFDEALQRIASAVDTYPESAQAHLGAARLLMATGDFNGAEEAVLEARALAGELSDIILLKAEIDLRQGDRVGALRAASDLEDLANLSVANSDLLSALGALQLRLDDLTKARRSLQMAVDAAPSPPPVALVNLVRLELLEDNPGAAERLLRQLESLGVYNEEIGLLQGDTLVAAQQINAARAHFAELAELGSRSGTSKLAMLDMQSNRFAEAEATLQAWLTEHPNDTGMQKLLATAQVQSGASAAARQQYEAMMPTDDPVVLNNLAWIYMTENDPRALDLARRANAAAPDNPDIQDTLGWILVNAGEAAEGLGLLRDSARQRPDNASVQYHLGVAYHKLGDRDNAIDALERALTIGDFNEAREARRILEELSSS